MEEETEFEDTKEEKLHIRGFTVAEIICLCLFGGFLCGFILGIILNIL